MSDKKANSLDVLNKFIEEGKPPEYVAQEYSSKGQVQTVFTWNCGTLLKVAYDTRREYLDTLVRFKEFWD